MLTEQNYAAVLAALEIPEVVEVQDDGRCARVTLLFSAPGACFTTTWQTVCRFAECCSLAAGTARTVDDLRGLGARVYNRFFRLLLSEVMQE